MGAGGVALPIEAAIEDLPLYFFSYNYRRGEVKEHVIAIDRGKYFEELKVENARTLGERLNEIVGKPDGGTIYIHTDAPHAFWGEKGTLVIAQPTRKAKRSLASAFAKKVEIKWKRV